jgi:hypothetical protein
VSGPIHGYNLGDEVLVRARVTEAHSDVWSTPIGNPARLCLPTTLGNDVRILIPLDDVRPSPQWRVFDKDDESTWPVEQVLYWVAVDEGGKTHVTERPWVGSNWSAHVTHWMPIEIPVPPTLSTHTPKDAQ